ncbi:glycosyltransferase family 2 protein [Rhodocaloribacter sp.]
MKVKRKGIIRRWRVVLFCMVGCLAVPGFAAPGAPSAAPPDAPDSTAAAHVRPRLAEPPAPGAPWDVVVEEPFRLRETFSADRPWWLKGLIFTLYLIIFLLCVYTARHYTFTYNRLFGRQRHPYVPLDTTDWPPVTVLIAAHNEEAVIRNILEALLAVDYPEERLLIMPVNDRSTDGTRAIIDAYAARHPERIRPFHRTGGKPGKAAALKDAVTLVETELMLNFDADYLPGRHLIKQLVAPFLDPEVGAVMGRVMPANTPRNLLTRLLDLERSGGYQVDQQARMNLGLIPQYGGTVGGVRRSALLSSGGWRDDSLTEDTDITCRLLLNGWKVAYSNWYECYEESPEEWPVRIRQIMRWARGHTDAAIRYTARIATSEHLRRRERLDGVLLLGVYVMAPILLLGWLLAIALFYLGLQTMHGVLALLAVATYNTIGNYAAFFEIAAAVHLDGSARRLRLLPLILFGFLISMISASRAALSQFHPRVRRRDIVWDKTKRYRHRKLYPPSDP